MFQMIWIHLIVLSWLSIATNASSNRHHDAAAPSAPSAADTSLAQGTMLQIQVKIRRDIPSDPENQYYVSIDPIIEGNDSRLDSETTMTAASSSEYTLALKWTTSTSNLRSSAADIAAVSSGLPKTSELLLTGSNSVSHLIPFEQGKNSKSTDVDDNDSILIIISLCTRRRRQMNESSMASGPIQYTDLRTLKRHIKRLPRTMAAALRRRQDLLTTVELEFEERGHQSDLADAPPFVHDAARPPLIKSATQPVWRGNPDTICTDAGNISSICTAGPSSTYSTMTTTKSFKVWAIISKMFFGFISVAVACKFVFYCFVTNDDIQQWALYYAQAVVTEEATGERDHGVIARGGIADCNAANDHAQRPLFSSRSQYGAKAAQDSQSLGEGSSIGDDKSKGTIEDENQEGVDQDVVSNKVNEHSGKGSNESHIFSPTDGLDEACHSSSTNRSSKSAAPGLYREEQASEKDDSSVKSLSPPTMHRRMGVNAGASFEDAIQHAFSTHSNVPLFVETNQTPQQRRLNVTLGGETHLRTPLVGPHDGYQGHNIQRHISQGDLPNYANEQRMSTAGQVFYSPSNQRDAQTKSFAPDFQRIGPEARDTSSRGQLQESTVPGLSDATMLLTSPNDRDPSQRLNPTVLVSDAPNAAVAALADGTEANVHNVVGVGGCHGLQLDANLHELDQHASEAALGIMLDSIAPATADTVEKADEPRSHSLGTPSQNTTRHFELTGTLLVENEVAANLSSGADLKMSKSIDFCHDKNGVVQKCFSRDKSPRPAFAQHVPPHLASITTGQDTSMALNDKRANSHGFMKENLLPKPNASTFENGAANAALTDELLQVAPRATYQFETSLTNAQSITQVQRCSTHSPKFSSAVLNCRSMASRSSATRSAALEDEPDTAINVDSFSVLETKVAEAKKEDAAGVHATEKEANNLSLGSDNFILPDVPEPPKATMHDFTPLPTSLTGTHESRLVHAPAVTSEIYPTLFPVAQAMNVATIPRCLDIHSDVGDTRKRSHVDATSHASDDEKSGVKKHKRNQVMHKTAEQPNPTSQNTSPGVSYVSTLPPDSRNSADTLLSDNLDWELSGSDRSHLNKVSPAAGASDEERRDRLDKLLLSQAPDDLSKPGSLIVQKRSRVNEGINAVENNMISNFMSQDELGFLASAASSSPERSNKQDSQKSISSPPEVCIPDYAPSIYLEAAAVAFSHSATLGFTAKGNMKLEKKARLKGLQISTCMNQEADDKIGLHGAKRKILKGMAKSRATSQRYTMIKIEGGSAANKAKFESRGEIATEHQLRGKPKPLKMARSSLSRRSNRINKPQPLVPLQPL
ncbi:hypothetical protein MPSEU_000343900 [Mayamaea pseudoterrestris]|nr:hypothetical protein MPSEU_000343900 [Mayamaea pseudoterrestris]